MTAEIKGIHVLAVLLAFFGVTIAVNVLLAVYAIGTFSGEDVSKPYVKGLEYNKTLAARAAAAALGWTAEIGATRDGADMIVSVRIAGRDGTPISGLAVEAQLRRPTDAALDRALTLEPVGGGLYRARVEEIAAGQWDVIARAAADDGRAFEAERRVVLK